MSGGSKTITSKETQTRDPYAPSLPGLQQIATSAMDVFGRGQGGNVYGGQRVAGLGDTTRAGIGSMTANAGKAGAATDAGNDFLTGLLGQGGSTAGIRDAVGAVQGVPGVDTGALTSLLGRASDPNNAAATASRALTGGQYALDGSGYADLNAGLAGPTQTQRSLQDVADGKFLGGANPYLDRIIGQGQDAAANQVKRSMAASGRYGSGVFQSALADSANRIGTEARYRDYDAERGRQAAAAGAIDSGLLARTGARSGLLGAQNDVRTGNANQMVQGAQIGAGADQAALQAAQVLGGAQQFNANFGLNRGQSLLSAAQADRAAGLGALGGIGTIQDAYGRPGQTLAQAGAIQDAARQQELAAAQDAFNERDTAPWKQLGLLAGTVLPVAGAGGTVSGTQTQQVPQPGLLQQILGGASAGIGLLGQTGAFATPAKGAASAGWLSSLFSDERLKDDIEEIGRTHDGQPIHRYRMAGDPRTQIGLLAQEVAEKRPGAVTTGPGGLLMVDYAKATDAAARKGASREARR